VNLVGSALFLIAVGLLYAMTGTLNLADLGQRLPQLAPLDRLLVESAALLLLTVFGLKAALFPLFLWLPSAYSAASAPVAALFAIMTKVGAYSILRVHTLIFGAGAGPAAGLSEPWLLPLALATVIVGMLGAVASTHLRRQVAWLVVASVGSLLAAFGLATTAGLAAGLYYLPHTTFATAALFLLADAIARRRGALGDRLDPGPATASPRLLGGLFFVAAMAVAGLPPLSGFLGKFLTLRAALDHPLLPWIMGAVLAAGLLGMIALARTGSLLFYRALPETGVPEALPALARETVPIIGLLLLGLGLTLGAGPLSDQARAIADQVLQPHTYIQAVLNPGGKP
jgi:multicomponent K+:H+ antiporter subunit D